MHKELHKNCTSAEKSQKLTNAKYGAISTGSEIIIGNFQTETMWYGKGHAGGEIAGEGKQKSRGYAGYWTGGERNELLLAILCRFPIMAHCCSPVVDGNFGLVNGLQPSRRYSPMTKTLFSQLAKWIGLPPAKSDSQHCTRTRSPFDRFRRQIAMSVGCAVTHLRFGALGCGLPWVWVRKSDQSRSVE